MRIIFLDIDGVLNSSRSGIGVIVQAIPDKESVKGANFDPVAVDLLRQLLENFDCKVVISSSWRFASETQTATWFNTVFEYLGIPKTCIGSTPFLAGTRGEEIALWLNRNSYLGVSDYIILDDDSDMLPSQESHLFQTDSEVGFGLKEFSAILHRWAKPITVDSVV